MPPDEATRFQTARNGRFADPMGFVHRVHVTFDETSRLVMRLLKRLLTRPRSRRRRRMRFHSQPLESRCLLSVSDVSVDVQPRADGGSWSVSWVESDAQEDARYDVWLDQNVTATQRVPRIVHLQDLALPTRSFDSERVLQPGNYTVYLRRTTASTTGRWVHTDFQVDDDNNHLTPLNIETPERPEITTLRQGQGAAGQKTSEGAITWNGDAGLYDVWLGIRQPDSDAERVALIRNVPGPFITLRHLAQAQNPNRTVFFSELNSEDAQLPTGEYSIYVRGVNGATDDNGEWIGRGRWSAGLDFSFHRIEGSTAVPDNLQWTNEIRPMISWNTVPHAEHYLVSLWKGPDYRNHRPVSFRVFGTQLHMGDNGSTAIIPSIEPGDEIYVRVRAVGSEGMLEGLRPGNFAAGVITIPEELAGTDIAVPEITGPLRTSPDTEPVLRWAHSQHAATYDVWFTSLQTGKRMFLATGISGQQFHLSPEALENHSDRTAGELTEYTERKGLADGRYRFWVRGRNPAADSPGAWSQSFDFTVERRSAVSLSLVNSDHPADTPLVAPNLIESYSRDGRRFVLISNGLGESFGASSLARFELDDDDTPFRPVVFNPHLQTHTLEFPDLPVGSNVTDLAWVDEHRLLVLSRSSNDIRLIDVAQWRLLSEYDLASGSPEGNPDVMDMEILANGQVLIVANRSARIRVLQIAADHRLVEVDVPESSRDDQGFKLPDGRAMQISSVALPNDEFRLFLATPTVHGVIAFDYVPATGQFRRVLDDAQSPLVISRNRLSGPHLGGRIKAVPVEGGSPRTFYLSTDRNGFMTWVDVVTLESGFLDLVDYLPDATRDPSDASYRNPDDSSIDPTRIVDVDADHIAVLSERERGVLLRLTTDQRGPVSVSGSAVLDLGYGGTVFSRGDDLQLLYTSRGLRSRAVGSHLLHNAGSHLLVSTLLTRSSASQPWAPHAVATTPLARPVNHATPIRDDKFLVRYADRKQIIQYDQSKQEFLLADLPTQFTDTKTGRVWADYGTQVGAFSEGNKDYVAFRVAEAGVAEPTEFFVIVLDVTDGNEPIIRSLHRMNSDFRVMYLHMDSDRMVLLDRLRGRMQTIHGWQKSESSSDVYEFHARHPIGFGTSRNGRVVMFPDGNRVVLHDTDPNRVFTVFQEGTAETHSVPTVHAHNTGQWINDMRYFDADRMIAVTWDARVIIFNVRTGQYELVRQLGSPDSRDLNFYGVRDIDYRDGVLAVSSPGTGLTAQFLISAYASGTGFDVQLTRVFPTKDVVTTLLNSEAQWAVQSTQLTRY